MANIKFSAFTQLAPIDQGLNGSYIVGYEGDANTNNRWTFGEVAIGLKAVTATPYSVYARDGSLESTRSVTFSAHDLKFIATGNGKLWYQDGNQAAGYVLKSDADGEASWAAETDTGVTGVTLAVGTGQTSPLTESITNRELTITSNKYGGASEIGYVPDGGANTTFLRGDGTWVTPTDSTDNAAGAVGQLQYTTGSGVFAATPDMVYTTDQLKVQNSIYLDGNNANAGIIKLGCEAAGASHYVGLEGPTHGGANAYTIKFPDATPTADQILKVNTVVSSTANMIWADDADTSIYAANGNLTSDRTVTMNNALGDTPYNLTFAGISPSKVTFSNLGGVEIARDLTVQKNVIIQGQGYSELHTGADISSIDWNLGNVQEITLASGEADFDPSNAKAGATYILKITQPSGGNGTINWDNIGAANIKWPGGTEPTLTATNAAIDIVTLICTSATGQGIYYANATLNFS